MHCLMLPDCLQKLINWNFRVVWSVLEPYTCVVQAWPNRDDFWAVVWPSSSWEILFSGAVREMVASGTPATAAHAAVVTSAVVIIATTTTTATAVVASLLRIVAQTCLFMPLQLPLFTIVAEEFQQQVSIAVNIKYLRLCWISRNPSIQLCILKIQRVTQLQ